MLKTGFLSAGEKAETASKLARGTTERPKILKSALRASLGTCALILALSAPLTIDITAGTLSVQPGVAFAGQGDGNFGQGKGNGGPNGENPGNGGGGTNNGGGGDGDGGDDGDDGGGGTDGTPPITQTGEDTGEGGADMAADLADTDFGDAVESVGGSPAEGPMAGAPATGLPTISQLFALGDDSAVSSDEELHLIANGWKAE